MDTTYRVVGIQSREFGATAATPQLAKLAAGHLHRGERLGLEQTDWIDDYGKKKISRTVLIEAEGRPGEWTVGGEVVTAL